MTIATTAPELSLVHVRPLWKAFAFIAAAILAMAFVAYLEIDARRVGPGNGVISGLTLALLGTMLALMLLSLRKRTVFSASGVTQVGLLRTTTLAWDEVTRCSVRQETLTPPKAATVHGVQIRFMSLRTDPSRILEHARPHDRAIELFLPDGEPPLPADIVTLLKTVPQLSKTPWALLERAGR